jgi:shikimate kinase
MGSGKSYYGKWMSKVLEIPFVDLDLAIERKAEKPIAQIFEEQSESAFRDIETSVLIEFMNSSSLILSLGGGTIFYNQNIELLKSSGKLVFIQTDFEKMWLQMNQKKDHRPLLFDKSKEEIYALYLSRLSGYMQSDFVFDTSQHIRLLIDYIKSN